MKASGYVVIYRWRGERHRDMQVFLSREHAEEAASVYRRDGLPAWVEEL